MENKTITIKKSLKSLQNLKYYFDIPEEFKFFQNLEKLYNIIESDSTSKDLTNKGYYYDETISLEDNVDLFNDRFTDISIKLTYLSYLLFEYFREIIWFIVVEKGNESLKKTLSEMYDINIFEEASNVINEVIKECELAAANKGMFEGTKKQVLFYGNHVKHDLINLSKHDIPATIRKIRNMANEEGEANRIFLEKLNRIVRYKLQRIHIGKKHRLIFLEQGNLFIVLGVALKTGESVDYNKYTGLFSQGGATKFNRFLIDAKEGKIDFDKQQEYVDILDPKETEKTL